MLVEKFIVRIMSTLHDQGIMKLKEDYACMIHGFLECIRIMLCNWLSLLHVNGCPSC